MMNAKIVKNIISKLIEEIEEEDIAISLLATQYQDPKELVFFKECDAEQVVKILTQLSTDSARHKGYLETLIGLLEDKCHEE